MIETVINQFLNKPLPKLEFLLPLSTTKYEASPVFLDQPIIHFSDKSKGFVELGFSLDINNAATKKMAEGIPGIVNPRHIGNRQDGQALLSSSMLHKAGWIINDSTLLSSFLISDALLPKSSPVHLFSDQLAILLPQLN